MNKSNRIEGFDFARAFAILGMMFVNYKIIFTNGLQKYLVLNDFISLFEGRAAAVFLVLAGIGIKLMTRKGYMSNNQEIKNKGRITLIRRAIFLFVLGMILYSIFEWDADILHYYGVYMVLICPFLYMKPKNILISIGFTLLITFLLQITMNYQLGWNESFTSYLDFYTLKGFIRNLFFNGYHPIFPWFTFILIGLLIGKIDFNNYSKVKFMTILSFSLAALIEFFSFIIIKFSHNSEIIIYLFDTKPMNPTVFYVFAASGWAIGFIGLNILLSKKLSKYKIYKAIVNTGQMALTHYIIHSILVLGIFDIIDKISYKDELFVMMLSIVVFVIMIVFSRLWLKLFNRGPLELLMRKLS